MNTAERVQESFKRLVEEGRACVQQCGYSPREQRYQFHPSTDDYYRFRTEALNLVRRACGSDSDHYVGLQRLAESKDATSNSYYYVNCLGILEAAQHDFDAGLLFDLRALIAAEVLSDFLEQSEVLFDAGFHVPAASLAGAVLEDTLRKLCERHGLQVATKTKIDTLNADLARKGVYDKLVQKRITAIADIRNNADHGHFDRFSKEDVEDMIKWVKRFSADNLQ